MAGILRDLVSEKKGIRENFEEQYFEFYVAAYTKVVKDQVVQQSHKDLYQDARRVLKCDPDDAQFPFGFKDPISKIFLVPEPSNPYDPSALLVYVEHPNNIVEYLQGEDTFTHRKLLGYVPKHISRIVSHNQHKLRPGWIKRVRYMASQYCSTKVAIPWAPDPDEEDLIIFDRLANLAGGEDD